MSLGHNEPPEYRKEWAEAATQAGVHVGLFTLFLGAGVGGAVLRAIEVAGGTAGLVSAFGGFLVVVGIAGTLIFARLAYSSVLHAFELAFNIRRSYSGDFRRMVLIIVVGFVLFFLAVMSLDSAPLLEALGFSPGAPGG